MVDESLDIKEKFVVFIKEPLTERQNRLLTFLYQPLIGTKAANLYPLLYSFCAPNEIESKPILHSRLYNLLKVKTIQDFENIRAQLEGVGLLDVFYKPPTNNDDAMFLYFVKPVKDAYDFFNDPYLSRLLESELSDDEYRELVMEMLVNKYDLSKFQKITKCFDEVFQVVGNQAIIDPTNLWTSNSNQGIVLKRVHLDYEYLVIVLSSLGIIQEEILKTRSFYETINKYCLIFNLTTDEIKDAIITSTTINKDIDYDQLLNQVKRIYDAKNQKVVYKPLAKTVSDNDDMIKTLEALTPREVIENLYGVPLTGSEIAMFDQLLTNTGFTRGILNVLIIYVTREKNGQIPSYNYFLKIANTWLRAGIKTTRDAIQYLPSQSQSRYQKKKTKDVPEWYGNYESNTKQKLIDEKQQQVVNASQETIDDLEKFFQSSKKK